MKKIILILLTFLLSLTIASCNSKSETNNSEQTFSKKLLKLVDQYTDNKYLDWDTREIKIHFSLTYDDGHIFSFKVYYNVLNHQVKCPVDEIIIKKSYLVGKYNFPFFYFLGCENDKADMFWFYYESEKLYDLNEAYEKGLVKEGFLDEALRRYLRSLNHTEEEIRLFMKSTENILSQKKTIEEKISNSYSKVIKDYDDSYTFEYSNNDEITVITDDYASRFFSYYPISIRCKVIKNGEQLGRIIIKSGFDRNPDFKKTSLYERPLYVMTYISNDDEIKGLYVIDHGIEDYPFDEDFDFGFVGKTKEDFKEQSIETSGLEYDENHLEIYQEIYRAYKTIFYDGWYYRTKIPEF